MQNINSDDKDAFESRVNTLEKEYEAATFGDVEAGQIDELFFKLSGLIGRNNLTFLREYTDRLIAHYNNDPGWFYRQGFEDACRMNDTNGNGADPRQPVK
jgi:hypothetical protein